MPDQKNLNMKFTAEDWEVMNMLREMYGMDNSNLVRTALRHILKTRPVFEIVPNQGKLGAHAVEAPLSQSIG